VQQWKATKRLHNLGKQRYPQKRRYEEQVKKVADLEKELHLYVLETMQRLLEKYMELNAKISAIQRFPIYSDTPREKHLINNAKVVYRRSNDRFAPLMYDIMHLLEQIELLPGGWNFFQQPSYQQPVSHSWHRNPAHPQYKHNHDKAEKIHLSILKDAALAVQAVDEFWAVKKLTAEDNAKLKEYASTPPFPIKYTITPWRDSAPDAEEDTRPLDWRNRLDWYSMQGIQNEGMQGIENADSSVLFHNTHKEIDSQWRSRGRMENLLANLQSAWTLLERLPINNEDLLDLKDDENQGHQWSCPHCRLNWTENPPLQATCPGGEGMQGSSRSFGNLIKAKHHIQKSLHYLNVNEAFGSPIRHRRTLHRLPGYEGVSYFPPKNAKYVHKAKVHFEGADFKGTGDRHFWVRLEISFEIITTSFETMKTFKGKEKRKTIKAKVLNITKYNEDGEKQILKEDQQHEIGSVVEIQQATRPKQVIITTSADDPFLRSVKWRLDIPFADLAKIGDQRIEDDLQDLLWEMDDVEETLKREQNLREKR